MQVKDMPVRNPGHTVTIGPRTPSPNGAVSRAPPTTAPAGDVAQASIHECKLREALGMVAPDGPRDARAESIASIIRSAKFRINNNLVLCESAEYACKNLGPILTWKRRRLHGFPDHVVLW